METVANIYMVAANVANMDHPNHVRLSLPWAPPLCILLVPFPLSSLT